MKKIFDIIKLLIYFIITLIVIFFSISNSELVKINFNFFIFNYGFEIRLFLLIIFCFCFGFLFGILASSFSLMKKTFENFIEKRKISKLEKNLQKAEEIRTNENNN